MSSSEKFCLRWNDFETNISVAFRELREEKDFFDVTLACDDSQIQAHKVILSACSPFFRNVLRRNPHQHPLLYLKGVKYKELLAVLNFMYQGEVNVAQEELNSFLAVAEELRVKGLTQNSGGAKEQTNDPPPKPARVREPPEREPPPPAKRPAIVRQQPQPPPQQHSYEPQAASQQYDDDIQEVVPVKSEPRDSLPVAVQQPVSVAAPVVQEQEQYSAQQGQELALDTETYADESYDYGQYGDGSYDDGSGMIDPNTGMPLQGAGGADGNKVGSDLHALIKSKMVKENSESTGVQNWRCADCGHISKRTTDLAKHIEAKHVGTAGYDCQYCGKHCPSKNSLTAHISRNHRPIY